MNLPFGTAPGVCRACAARMIWAVTADGKRMPLDPRPDSMGNCFFPTGAELAASAIEDALKDKMPVVRGQVVVVGAAAKARLDAARVRNKLEPIEWWMRHFATCPWALRAQGRGRR